MNKSLKLMLDVELAASGIDRKSTASVDGPALALSDVVIAQLLPRLAEATGVELSRLSRCLLVELGHAVGLSHAPATAVDTLAVATERMRDALAARRERQGGPAVPTVRGPTRIQ